MRGGDVRETERYRERIFVGVSKDIPENEGTDVSDASLDEAFDDAWEQVRAAGLDPKARMHVLDIEVYGRNPIDMYRVVVKVDI